MQQREHVLQLIAESEGPARLIRAAAGPDAAAEGLVQQPAVHDQVERIVGRANLDRSEAVVPRPLGGGERRLHGLEPPVVLDERAAVCVVAALPERKRHAARLAGLELDDDLQRRARVETGAGPSAEALAKERRRRRQRPVTSDELDAIGGVRLRRLAGAEERQGPGPLRVVGVGREHRAGHRIDVGDHEPVLADTRRPEPPLHVAEHADAPPLVRRVRQRQQRELDRIVRGHEHRKFLRHARHRVLIARDARGVPDHPAPAVGAPRQRRRRRAPTPRPFLRRAGRSPRRWDPPAGRWRTA